LSNKLYNQAQRIRIIVPVGAGGLRGVARAIHASEMAVLLALANDARDTEQGCSRLRTVKIMARTRLSEPAVRKAYRQLQANGHITRQRGAEGEAATTLVHPIVNAETTARAPKRATPERVRPLSPVQETRISNIGNPCIGDMGLVREELDLTKNHSLPGKQASAPVEDVSGTAQPDPVDPDPVESVFDAWDAWTRRAGLPGPVQRDAARRVAVANKLAAVGLGQVMMAIGTVERGVAAGGFRRKGAIPGQGDLFCTFDAVFEVGHAVALRLFTRLLDGEFGRPAEKVQPGAANSQPDDANSQSDEPPRVQAIRAALRERLGPSTSAAWIDRLRLEEAGGELLALAPNAFHADFVSTNLAHELRRAAGGPVRIAVRETAGV
jgi:hypothetical protein